MARNRHDLPQRYPCIIKMGRQRSPKTVGRHPLKSQQIAGPPQRLIHRPRADVLPGWPFPHPLKMIDSRPFALNPILLHRRSGPLRRRKQIAGIRELRQGDRAFQLRHHHHLFGAIGLSLMHHHLPRADVFHPQGTHLTNAATGVIGQLGDQDMGRPQLLPKLRQLILT